MAKVEAIGKNVSVTGAPKRVRAAPPATKVSRGAPPAVNAQQEKHLLKKLARTHGNPDANKSNHLGCTSKCKGPWDKPHGGYGTNCYTETTGVAAKKALYVVSAFPNKYIDYFLKQKFVNPCKLGALDIGTGKNYNGQSAKPLSFRTHHIIPATSLTKGLNVKERSLLQFAGYNLNGEDNTIFLPNKLADANFIELPDHPGGHPTYNDELETIVKRLKDAVDQETGNHGVTPGNVGKLRDRLDNKSREFFTALVKWGWKAKDLGRPSNRVNQNRK